MASVVKEKVHCVSSWLNDKDDSENGWRSVDAVPGQKGVDLG